MNAGRVTLGKLCLYFLRLGSLGFGGPIALVGAMERDLVEKRGWVSPVDFAEGLALAQLAPGPLAAQLAIYIGYLRGGVLGANLVGATFILPSFVMVLEYTDRGPRARAEATEERRSRTDNDACPSRAAGRAGDRRGAAP